MRLGTHLAHGSNNTDGLVARDERELGNELALVDVLLEVSPWAGLQGTTLDFLLVLEAPSAVISEGYDRSLPGLFRTHHKPSPSREYRHLEALEEESPQ